jgi:hypothetical protein
MPGPAQCPQFAILPTFRTARAKVAMGKDRTYRLARRTSAYGRQGEVTNGRFGASKLAEPGFG